MPVQLHHRYRSRFVSRLAIGLLLALIVFVIGFGTRADAIRFWSEEEAVPTPKPAVEAKPQTANRGLPQFADLVENLSPAVVNISTTYQSGGGPGGGGPGPRQFGGPQRDREFWEPFERFFGPAPRQRPRQRSLGSGFILNHDGLILTNNHVVENAEKILVRLDNEHEYEATLIGRDPKTDIAVIKIEADKEKLTPAVLGDSESLRVGDWIIAIGNPFGLEHTVTSGIVSAKGRFIGQGSYDDFIQTDAAINPGNSGGPLVNLDGEVVGINSAIFSRSGGNIGIGFAIPINLAKELLPQLKEKGKVTRGWLGVYIQKVTPEIAESLGLADDKGALVADVMPDTPAEEAGIEVGDVIVEFDGQKVEDSTDLPTIVARTPISKAVPVKVIRNDKVETVSVQVGELKDEEVAVAQGESQQFGLTVQTLTPEIAENLSIDASTKGVVVSGVEPGGAAEEAGIQRGDVILEINRKPVKNVADYNKALPKEDSDKSTLFLVRRGESTIFLALKPESD